LADPSLASAPISENLSVRLCAETVRRNDRDRYLAVLHAPPDRREALLALYAFNLELALVRESVSESTLGLIRFQWWRETLDGVFAGGAVRHHAVAMALAGAVRRHGLGRESFDRLIDGREFDLEDRQPESLDTLAAYAGMTAGTLCELALAVLGVRDAVAAEAARHAGTAYGLAGLLRAVPFHAAQQRVYLPSVPMRVHGATPSDLFGGGGPAISRVVADVARRAQDHLHAARQYSSVVPKEALPGLLPLVLAEHDLRRLERAGFDVFALRPGVPVVRQIRLMWAASRGRY
jgi:phytoene synthase